MSLDPGLLKRIQKAIESGEAATRDDLVENLEDEFTVSPNFMAYANLKVTNHIDAMQIQPVTHLKFTPLVDDGIVIVQPTTKGEKGAEEFVRGETRRTGRVNVRAALNGFDLAFPETRSLRLKVETQNVAAASGPRAILLIKVQTPETKPIISRPRKPKDAETAAPGSQTPNEDEQNKA